MAAIAGTDGAVKLGANTVTLVTEWSFDGEVDMLETSAIGSGNRTYIPGLFGATGTITASFDMTDTNGQKALHDAFFNKTSVALTLRANSSGTLGTYTAAVAFINKISPAVAVDAKVEISFDFTVSGAVTFA